MKFKMLLSTMLSGALFSLSLAHQAPAAEYQHTLAVEQMSFSWTVNADALAVRLSAPTTGWLAIGFNPTDMMNNANIIIGYVKDGNVELSDDFGSGPTTHMPDDKRGGVSNVTVVGGGETGNTTTVEFSIPLNSGDVNDGVINPTADTKIILAYGPDRDSFKMKHQFAKAITVNLASGAQK